MFLTYLRLWSLRFVVVSSSRADNACHSAASSISLSHCCPLDNGRSSSRSNSVGELPRVAFVPSSTMRLQLPSSSLWRKILRRKLISCVANWILICRLSLSAAGHDNQICKLIESFLRNFSLSADGNEIEREIPLRIWKVVKEIWDRKFQWWLGKNVI